MNTNKLALDARESLEPLLNRLQDNNSIGRVVCALSALDAIIDAEAVQVADSTPLLHIGESSFEIWYQSYGPKNSSDKQCARDAYAAGMGDPLVTYVEASQEPRCPYCDGSGDVHRADGEWLGTCTCPAGDAQVEPVVPRKDVILEALHDYHCSESLDDTGSGSKLVDALTHSGDIGPGLREIEALADFIWGALADATPQQAAPELGADAARYRIIRNWPFAQSALVPEWPTWGPGTHYPEAADVVDARVDWYAETLIHDAAPKDAS